MTEDKQHRPSRRGNNSDRKLQSQEESDTKNVPQRHRKESPPAPSDTPRGDISQAQSASESKPSPAGCPVIGIGASAGGLDAIGGLLDHFPEDANVALVIVQHRAHDHKSMMASLLSKHTRLRVEELTDSSDIEPNTIYLAPAEKDVSVMNGALYCMEPEQRKGPPLPIDHLFRSLAQDQAERAVGIVLSGTGSDGSLGIRDIKAAGGMAIAQDPKEAAYDQMPRNAIDTGLIDRIRPVREIPKEAIGYLNHPYIRRNGTEDPEKKLEDQLQRIFLIIRQETGHDFSHYKRNTIKRRIGRRLALHQIERLDDYIGYLRNNGKEAQILSKDLLITVTAFFRDPDAFQMLAEKVIRPLIENRPANAALRIWVPGCATGEEAYSVAMLVYEQMHKSNRLHDVQLFGTDLDEDVIERARYGRYPKSIAGDLSKERLGQFFTEEDNCYRIKTHIREMLVFAKHNLVKEPPFSKLDLICCRNVLIYMDTTLQQKVLPMFHYALRSGGYLLLGESESIGGFADLFEPVDTRHKIFRHKPGRVDYERRTVDFAGPSQRVPRRDSSSERSQRRIRDVSGLAQRLILREYSVPCVLIDMDANILYFNGDTSPYLVQPGGEPTSNLLEMARPEIHHKLTAVIKRARREHGQVTEEKIPVGVDAAHSGTDIIVRPIHEFEGRGGLMLVVFRPHERPSGSDHPEARVDDASDEERDTRIYALEQELHSTREYLQTTIEELETSNEELKSANEELQSTNEELQSTNEELDTSREELQSTNEELRSVNAEHQARIEELSKTNDDMKNLLDCTEVATLFLDKNMRIRLFTPAIRNLFRLMDRDLGRPLEDITTVIEYDSFRQDLHSVFQSLERIEKEVQVRERCYILRIVPYRTAYNVIDGVVATFVDVTQQKKATLALQQRDFAEAVMQSIRDPLLVLDEKLNVALANNAFYRHFQVKPNETEGRLIYDLGDGQWNIPKLRELLEQIVPENTVFDDFVVEHAFPHIGYRKMILNARQTQQGHKQMGYVLLAFEDATADTHERKDSPPST